MSIGGRWGHWQYERKCLKYFGAKPETIILPKENFDRLIQRLNKPPNPETIRRFKEIMNRTSPWENTNKKSN